MIEVDGDLAGFALVLDHSPLTGRAPCWFMAEFFVLRAYRRRGVGRAALEAVLAHHPGDWQIGVIEANRRAAAFWQTALTPRAPVLTSLDHDGERWRLAVFRV